MAGPGQGIVSGHASSIDTDAVSKRWPLRLRPRRRSLSGDDERRGRRGRGPVDPDRELPEVPRPGEAEGRAPVRLPRRRCWARATPGRRPSCRARPAASELIRRVTATDATVRMPPGRGRPDRGPGRYPPEVDRGRGRVAARPGPAADRADRAGRSPTTTAGTGRSGRSPRSNRPPSPMPAGPAPRSTGSSSPGWRPRA